MTLSVIIPVYNAMLTLMRCVDSIVLQPVDGLEIILVDDGSTDGSAGLCDNIKRQYEDDSLRIIVIHQQNQGLSAARNSGIAAATGELLTFVDADDFLGKNTYARQMEFFECADDVDVVEYPVAKFYNDFIKKENVTFPVEFFDSALDYLFETEAFRHSYAVNKIYRRRLFADGEAFYPVGKTFEDIAALPKWLSRARRIVTSDSGFYFYTLNPQGICHTSGQRQYKDHLEAMLALLRFIPKERRKGAVYVRLYASMLNIRKDYLKTSPAEDVSIDVAPPSWADICKAAMHGIRKAELMKVAAMKLS